MIKTKENWKVDRFIAYFATSGFREAIDANQGSVANGINKPIGSGDGCLPNLSQSELRFGFGVEEQSRKAAGHGGYNGKKSRASHVFRVPFEVNEPN